MAMTLEQLREKIKGINQKNGGRNRNLWKPTDHHIIRLLPLKDKTIDEPYHAVSVHWVNGKSIYCPRTGGDECVICEYADKLKSFNDENGEKKPKHIKDADWEVFKKIQAGESYYFAMIERKTNEDKSVTNDGPFWWRAPKTLLGEILKICSDEGWNEQHVENGGGGVMEILFDEKYALDIEVDLQQPQNKDGKGNNKLFKITEIKERKRFTPISKDRDEVSKILDSIPNFGDIVKVLTSDEVAKMWDEIMAAGLQLDEKKAETDGTEVSAKDDAPASNNAEQPVTGTETVSDAVKKLLAKKNVG